MFRRQSISVLVSRLLLFQLHTVSVVITALFPFFGVTYTNSYKTAYFPDFCGQGKALGEGWVGIMVLSCGVVKSTGAVTVRLSL